MNKCDWHKDDQPVEGGISCEYCSTLLETKDCEGCGKEFLDWSAKGFDDIIAAPYVSASGDLMCARCGPRHDREAEESEDEEYYGVEYEL